MRINGFEQIKSLYSIVFDGKHPFKPQHISLYVFLINQNNRNNWVEWFKCPFDLAMAGACIGSKKTYYQCLNDLQEWDLLKYEKGSNEWKSPKIKLEVLKCTSTNTSSVPQSEPQVEPLPTPQGTPQGIPSIKPITIKQDNYKPIYHIVEFLNKTTGREYKSNSKKTQDLIRARMKEGFSVQDFERVIEGRFHKWGQDPKMREYLRPDTLFGTKFEAYLQDAPIKKVPVKQEVEINGGWG